VTLLRVSLIMALVGLGTSAQHPAELTAARLISTPGYRVAAQLIDQEYDRFVAELIELSEVPAPPFGEEARAELFARLARNSGLRDVERDAEGNVLALRRGNGGPLVVFSAHLDTVFPAGTPVKVQRNGTILSGPGVGDNAQGLAALLAVARALDHGLLQTTSGILFVANVGEEGAGGLRGVRHLLQQGKYRDEVHAFVAVDSTGNGSFVTTGGVGSKRYRVTLTGPGGHSYGAFGLVNPATALGAAMQQIAAISVPETPRTTFNVGMIGGGTSVNTIPASVWMEVDLRSESPEQLGRLDSEFRSAVARAVEAENAARSTLQGSVAASIELTGERPSGMTPQSGALVQAVSAAIRATGQQPVYGWSSTDANLPMSLGIPAVTIDTGIRGDRAHAPDEWIDVERRRTVAGLQRLLLILLSVAG
jgi:tripeptide aminopeptidase